MGGIADYTGAMVCEGTLDRAAGVALAQRPDRDIQVFSFNLFDEHKPFTLRISLDALAAASAESLRRDFNADPNRRWAAYLIGCFFVLHEAKLIDLADPNMRGLDLALHTSIPIGAGVSSSAAIEVATMMNLRDHFNLGDRLDPMRLAALCQRVENAIVGAPCGIMDQVTSCAGRAGSLLKLFCQPHELRGTLALPEGIRAIGINTGVRHSVGGGRYGRTRTAAFMGHRMILEKMRQFGHAAGKDLVGDPTDGYLANLPLDDYKHYFRSFLPESMKGDEFIATYGATMDTATKVDLGESYPVQSATDHHVHEADRVQNFIAFIEKAGAMAPHTAERSVILDMAGHLMYGSHVSYTRDALLGAEECDVLVELVRKNERAGFYGAKITGGGQGGTVAILANIGEKTDDGIADLMSEYEKRTGRKAEALTGTSEGAWEVGTVVI